MIQRRRYSPHDLAWLGLVPLAVLVVFPFRHAPGTAAPAAPSAPPPYAAAFAGRSSHYGILLHAISLRDPEAVRAALDSGSDPNFTPPAPGGMCPRPLCMAAQSGDTAIVRVLLDRGADIEIGDGFHCTPLAAAASAGSVPIVRYLISRGAKVNDRPRGSTALWAAAVRGSADVAAVLLAHGANPNTALDPADPAYRVLDAAREYHSDAVAALLRRHGAKPPTGRRGRWRGYPGIPPHGLFGFPPMGDPA